MSQSARLIALAQAIGADVKVLLSSIADLRLSSDLANTFVATPPVGAKLGQRLYHSTYNCVFQWDGKMWRQDTMMYATDSSARTQSNRNRALWLHSGLLCTQTDTGDLWTWRIDPNGVAGWAKLATYIPGLGLVANTDPNLLSFDGNAAGAAASRLSYVVKAGRLYRYAWQDTGIKGSGTYSYITIQAGYDASSTLTSVASTRTQNTGAKVVEKYFTAPKTASATFGIVFDTSTMGVAGFYGTLSDAGNVDDPQYASLVAGATSIPG